MQTILIALVVFLFAADSQARMICQDRPNILRYRFSAEESPGGNCGPLEQLLVYAPRNTGTFFDFTFASAESKISPNKCVETIEGLAWHGIQWRATESWNSDGTYGLAHYKITQSWQDKDCESEYTVKMTRRKAPWLILDEDVNGTETNENGGSDPETYTAIP